MSPLDLHVLGTPPAFVLSQNQTLLFILLSHLPAPRFPSSCSRSSCLRFSLSDKLHSYEIDCLFCVYFSYPVSFSRSSRASSQVPPRVFPPVRRFVILPNYSSCVKYLFLPSSTVFAVFLSQFFVNKNSRIPQSRPLCENKVQHHQRSGIAPRHHQP